MRKKLIQIDLDGVLNEYKGDYKKDFIPEIKKGARDFLEKLSEDFEIEIFTVRDYLLTKEWLIKNNLIKFIKNITNIKSSNASIILDDRAVNFNGDFNFVYLNIKNFK